jgi:hypothetical protein
MTMDLSNVNRYDNETGYMATEGARVSGLGRDHTIGEGGITVEDCRRRETDFEELDGVRRSSTARARWRATGNMI